MADTLGIIIAYNHEKTLRLCIQSAAESSHSVDWIIWCNGGISQDISVPTGMQIVFSETNKLWTPALNEAIETYLKPHHKFILYMNHDLSLSSNTVEDMVEALTTIPQAGAVAPVGSGLGGLQDYVSNKSLYGDGAPIRAHYLIGTCQMMTTETYCTVGPFDNNMPLGADDFDYSIRMKEAGYSLWVLPKVYITHIGHITRDSNNWNLYGQGGWDVFNSKYANYYTEQEAISFWNSLYDERYPIGTGISREEKLERGIIQSI